MSNAEPDAAAYGLAALHLAWDEFQPAVASLVHCGTTAEAMRTWHLGGGFDGTVTYLEVFYEILATNPLAVVAADELGVLGCVRNEMWVTAIPTWQRISERAAGLRVPRYPDTERCYRRAAVEYTIEECTLVAGESDESPPPKTAVPAFVEVYAASRVRWNDRGFELTACHDGDADAAARAVLRDLIDADPIARSAEASLSDPWRRAAAGIVDEDWPSIRERAETLEAVSVILDPAAL
ncbi:MULTISPECIES: hypothetical protein [unclassified Mycobacterium]|uniref:hypothetical protein n=1 Tax=unclassified Mycobacterium TaxID=2642494 RepID=UPI0009944026|nr:MULTISPECIES: hypothetical protein [unclassified Mycobacterium]